MARNFPLAKGTIPCMLAFGLIGAFSLAVAGSDFYDWWFTGNLYAPAKYSHGIYTYSDAPGLFAAAVLKNLLILTAGVVCIVAACIAPSFFRKREQARLAKAQPPHPPWPHRPKTPAEIDI